MYHFTDSGSNQPFLNRILSQIQGVFQLQTEHNRCLYCGHYLGGHHDLRILRFLRSQPDSQVHQI